MNVYRVRISDDNKNTVMSYEKVELNSLTDVEQECIIYYGSYLSSNIHLILDIDKKYKNQKVLSSINMQIIKLIRDSKLNELI